jgi:hypothetical protein
MTATDELRAGQWATVRQASEILATLDADGALAGVPFMPEMVPFLGRRLRVHRRADKTCVEGGGLRRLGAAVLLEGSRCDGAAHDGCQRGCMIFWPEAWLRPEDERRPVVNLRGEAEARETLLALATRRGELYHCQSTALPEATRQLSPWSYGLVASDLAKGEIGLHGAVSVVFRTLANRVLRMLGRGELDQLAGDAVKPRRGKLALRTGEWVRIKPAQAVRATLGPDGRNRGLSFEPEMTRHVGKTYQVDQVIERIILEETGRMAQLKATVSLKAVTCQGLCAKNCPRNNPLFWREAWLERVDAVAAPPPRAEAPAEPPRKSVAAA